MTLQSAPCGAGLGLETLPDPYGPEPWGEAEESWATLHSVAYWPVFWRQSRDWHTKKASTKKQTLSPFSICLQPCLCLMSIPLMCLITSASYPSCKISGMDFINFIFSRHSVLYSLSLQFFQDFPCAWMKLQKEICFRHSGKFWHAVGHCSLCFPLLALSPSDPSPLKSLGEAQPGPQCLSEY